MHYPNSNPKKCIPNPIPNNNPNCKPMGFFSNLFAMVEFAFAGRYLLSTYNKCSHKSTYHKNLTLTIDGSREYLIWLPLSSMSVDRWSTICQHRIATVANRITATILMISANKCHKMFTRRRLDLQHVPFRTYSLNNNVLIIDKQNNTMSTKVNNDHAHFVKYLIFAQKRGIHLVK